MRHISNILGVELFSKQKMLSADKGLIAYGMMWTAGSAKLSWKRIAGDERWRKTLFLKKRIPRSLLSAQVEDPRRNENMNT